MQPRLSLSWRIGGFERTKFDCSFVETLRFPVQAVVFRLPGGDDGVVAFLQQISGLVPVGSQGAGIGSRSSAWRDS